MYIIAKIDPDQTDHHNRDDCAICPKCGQKIYEVLFLFGEGLTRPKCRRCGTYLRVAIIGKKD